MPESSFRFRGLRYRRDAPFDREEGEGVLAEDVVLDGVRLTAGTKVWRDIDFDFVWVDASEPISVRGYEVPSGATIELLRSRPRSPVEWIYRILVFHPVQVVWVLVVGTSELLDGKWKPWQRRAESSDVDPSPVVAFVHLPSPDGDSTRRVVWIHDDGTLTERVHET